MEMLRCGNGGNLPQLPTLAIWQPAGGSLITGESETMVGGMTYERLGDSALDYFPCRYGTSKLLFRGPRRKLEGAYCAVLGGTETYGKFIAQPYPALVEAATGITMVNFGCVNAGTDVYVNDPAVIEACVKARVTVVQVTGAHNTSNRFYAVHPRRNDRFLRASTLLKAIYREVDFTEFHFTRHMLSALLTLSPERFAVVAEELQAAWVARMKLLLGKTEGQTVVLWMSNHTPEEADEIGGLGQDPVLVNRDMIEAIRPYATDVVEVVSSIKARTSGLEGKVYSTLEEPAAQETPGPLMHEEVAAALMPVVERML
jgi:Domain of unknown function (DUF6473)